MPSTHAKLIITPNTIHVYQYSKPVIYGQTRKTHSKRPKNPRAKSSPRDNLRNGWRAKKQVRLILEGNAVPQTFATNGTSRPLFVTLTFAKNITNLTEANLEFRHFIKRLNRAIQTHHRFINTPVKYLVVPEFQKRGAVHYHIIFFEFPKLDDTNEFLNKIWGHGFTFNNTLKSVKHLKNYVTKYFVKNFADERLRGKKHYFCSRGLDRPRTFYNQENNHAILSIINTADYEGEFNNENGLTMYTIHNDHPLIPLLYKQKTPVDNLIDMEK